MMLSPIRSTGFLFFSLALAASAQVSTTASTDIFVYAVYGLTGDPFPGVTVELLDTRGKSIARGRSTAEQPVVTLKGIMRGSYSLRLQHAEMRTITRPIELFRSEHWFTQSLIGEPPESAFTSPEERRVDTHLATLSGRVFGTPTSGNQPMWARVVGIHSTVAADSRIRNDGSFDFRIQPGWYVLLIMHGTQVCDMRQVHPFQLKEGLEIKLAPGTCR